MKLLGEWNWYLPAWLEWIPHGPPAAGAAPGPASSTAPVPGWRHEMSER